MSTLGGKMGRYTKIFAAASALLASSGAYAFSPSISVQAYIKSGSTPYNPGAHRDVRVFILKGASKIWCKDITSSSNVITAGVFNSGALSGASDTCPGVTGNPQLTDVFAGSGSSDNYTATVVVDVDGNNIGTGTDATFSGILMTAVPFALVARNLVPNGATNGQYLKFNGTSNEWEPTTLSLSSSDISSGGVASSNIAAGAVDSNALGAGAVTSAKITAGAVDTNALGTGAVTSAKIAAGAVDSTALGTSAVTSTKIAAGAVDTNALGAGAVTTAKLAAGAVDSTLLAADSVTTSAIVDANVTTAKIADANITTAKFATGAVDSAALGAGSVINAKIANSTIDLTAKVTGSLPVANGGTGGTDAATARSGLSAAKSGANSDITSLTAVTSVVSSGNLSAASAAGSTTTIGDGTAASATVIQSGSGKIAIGGTPFTKILTGQATGLNITATNAGQAVTVTGAAAGDAAFCTITSASAPTTANYWTVTPYVLSADTVTVHLVKVSGGTAISAIRCVVFKL